ncbi:hypothetical protein [Dokdonella sp.]|nr:hypothetical protein [Dokdonella sp.]
MKAVVLTGQVLPGADAGQVWRNIAGLLKMDAAQFRTRVFAR